MSSNSHSPFLAARPCSLPFDQIGPEEGRTGGIQTQHTERESGAHFVECTHRRDPVRYQKKEKETHTHFAFSNSQNEHDGLLISRREMFNALILGFRKGVGCGLE